MGDPDSDALTYQWVQRSGTRVGLVGENTPILTFDTSGISGELVFELRVEDVLGLSDTDTVSVSVAEQDPAATSGDSGSSSAGLLTLLALSLAYARRTTRRRYPQTPARSTAHNS